MKFDYERSVWGRGTAGLDLKDPTSIRLRNALQAIKDLPSGSRVLELGCGAGQFIRAIKNLRPQLECYGSDISYSAIQLAKQSMDGVNYSFHKADKLPFQDEFFDAVIVLDVLEHVSEPQALLRQIGSILKPGGVLFTFVPCEGDGLSIWNLLRRLGFGKELTKKYAGHIQYFSRKNLQKLIGETGFKVFKMRYSEHFIGQLLGVAAFTAMEIFSPKTGEQVNNEAFFSNNKNKIVVIFKNFVNRLVALESMVFASIPSPNMYVFARKNK